MGLVKYREDQIAVVDRNDIVRRIARNASEKLLLRHAVPPIDRLEADNGACRLAHTFRGMECCTCNDLAAFVGHDIELDFGLGGSNLGLDAQL